ncbi:hypothetical protein NM688_g2381 [Phlebia brevispora]|uniref:Uncharacterized protein n=1 Tax=Phlebia brevispora TaxID=194682 RepID=A0ACC1T8I7_9APHY|nr:hypothetical protein NM688_g2381 [Phlebia brevispora]
MYSQSKVQKLPHSSNLYVAQEERVELPAIFTPGGSAQDPDLLGLPADVDNVEQDQDQDQKISQQFRLASQPHLQVASVPTPSPESFFLASPVSDEISEADLSLSPAAMFLSHFSPSAPTCPLPDDEGEVVCGYTLGPIIGYGGFSTIRRASSPNGGVVAIKIVRRTDIEKHDDPERAKKHLEHEAAVWSSLCHENILPLFTSSHTSYADFFVTLYCPAGSLFDLLKRDGRPGLSPDEAARVFRQVVKGLRYMHEVAGFVHGDMKLENVLVDEMGVCRITDFGMARKIGECESSDDDDDGASQSSRSSQSVSLRSSKSLKQKRARSRHPIPGALATHLSLMRHHGGARHRNSSPFPTASVPPMPNQIFQPGSLPYASPELLLPSSSAAPYRPHPAQDIWALGVMLYVLLSGKMPFADSFEPRLQMKILHGKLCQTVITRRR